MLSDTGRALASEGHLTSRSELQRPAVGVPAALDALLPLWFKVLHYGTAVLVEVVEAFHEENNEHNDETDHADSDSDREWVQVLPHAAQLCLVPGVASGCGHQAQSGCWV